MSGEQRRTGTPIQTAEQRFRLQMADILVDGEGLPLSDVDAVELTRELLTEHGPMGYVYDTMVRMRVVGVDTRGGETTPYRIRFGGAHYLRVDGEAQPTPTNGIAIDPANPQPGEWLPAGMTPTVLGVWGTASNAVVTYRNKREIDRTADLPASCAARWYFIGHLCSDPPAEPAPEGVWMSAADARKGWVTGRMWLRAWHGAPDIWEGDDAPLNSDFDDDRFYLVPRPMGRAS